MTRLLVDAVEELQVLAPIPDVSAIELVPDGTNFRTFCPWFTGGIVPAGAVPAPQASPGTGPKIQNRDSIDHDFLFYLRGTGVPGGSKQVFSGAQTIAAGVEGAYAVTFTPPGMRLETEMQEPVTTTAPLASGRLITQLDRPLTVAGYKFGVQMDLLSDTVPSVLTAPAGVRRVVMASLAPLFPLSILVNSDAVVHTWTFTHSSAGVVEVDAAVAVDGMVQPPSIALEPGESLSCLQSAAVDTADAFIYWAYADTLIGA